VLVGGFVPAVRGVATLNMRISKGRSMAMRIWRFFMELAVTIAFSVRIGITAAQQQNTNPL